MGVVIPYLGRNYVIDVPCCAGCESGIVGQRRKRNLALWGASILVAFIVFPYLDGLARPLRKPVGLAVFLVLLAPVLYVQFLRPPPFDLYVRSGNVDLEFEDADYAAEVYALNSHAGATIN